MIQFAGEGKKDVNIDVSTAEARSANVGSGGPIDSPVPDKGATMNTSDLQKYANTPTSGGRGVDFVEGGSRD